MDQRASIPILLVTGFLGSGKTTFLNKLVPRLRKEGQRVAVLLNEIGDQNVDTYLVKESDHLAEVLQGSVFCGCVRTELVETLQRVAAEVKPDVLVMEASGVADPGPGGLQEALEIAQEYRVAHTFCLAAADRAYKLVLTCAAVRRQLAQANLVIVTGTDRAKPSEVAETYQAIANLDTQALVVEAPFAHLPEEVWEKLLASTQAGAAISPVYPNDATETDAEPVREQYDTIVVPVESLQGASGAEAITQLLPPGTERAKGFVEIAGEQLLYNFANGRGSLERVHRLTAKSGFVLAIGRFPKLVQLD